MEYKELIGKKVKGFKFETEKFCAFLFPEQMYEYIGKLGTIIDYRKRLNSYTVEFEDEQKWAYPAELIEQHLVEDNETLEETKTPQHYQNPKGYDVIDIANDYKLNFNRGSAIKYICRAGKKDCEIKDLNKAIDFLQREIKFLELNNK